MNPLRVLLQVLVPVVVLGGGGLLAFRIAGNAKPPTVVHAPVAPPLVRTARAEASADARLDVLTQGTLEALRIVDLSSEVAGRIVTTNDAMRAGGTFTAGDTLVTIDPTDFDFAITGQEAAVARAELRVLQEKAEADAAVRAWQQLEGERTAEPLVTRAPQIRDAEATLAAARAALAKSRIDRARTEVKAPFTGRVRSVAADQGQTVMPGQRLAILVDDSAVEARLPIPVGDAAFVDLPLVEVNAPGTGPIVELTVDFAGRQHVWQGHIVRTEGEIDRRTRQLVVIARVDDARAKGTGSDAARPPLLIGQFVQARIRGRTFPSAVAIPRAALRPDGSVWVIDGERRLRRRAVDVLRIEAERAILRGGLVTGELVCLSALETAGDGTLVAIAAPAAESGSSK